MSFSPFAPAPSRYRTQRSASFSAPAQPATFATQSRGSYSAPKAPMQRAQQRSASFGPGPRPRMKLPQQRGGYSVPAASRYQHRSRAFGQAEPPPVQSPNWGLVLGWVAVVGAAVGVFYGVTAEGGPKWPLRANRHRKRRSSKRRRSRRNSRRPRRNSRRYKALSAASRKRMSPSSFALSGKRFPIKGPPGSSRQRDRWQAEQAIRYLTMGRVASKSDYLKVRNAIIREYGTGFWQRNNGPSWAKVEQAKRKRRSSRRRSRRPSRLAANRRTSRRKGRRVLANSLSEADKKFAKKIAMDGIPRTKAAMNKTKAQIRKRLPPPNEAEIKLWNKGNRSERSGTGISKAMDRYAKRTGLPKWAVTYVLQLGWQNTRGNLSLR